MGGIKDFRKRIREQVYQGYKQLSESSGIIVGHFGTTMWVTRSTLCMSMPMLVYEYILRDTTRSTVVIWVKDVQNDGLMMEIYSKSLVRAIGKVLCMKLS